MRAITQFICFGIIALGCIGPLVWWGFHPGQTQMQVFLEWWWAWLGTFAALGVIVYLEIKEVKRDHRT